ncbi:TPT-domain-containing protein [Dacryopinax primogenitus]|uniref:TPT-domain-containing protein n=1 Tax=Dacryopinax primogenitus (strain DJM 731) TaxID=1858805 RepID=M5GBF4_DACPD|nr:TPT-domain-containing protein [Dacryopinax primogenitus]EJU01333.1 TPT-domain-containing protein [Dacryopinax primogenitus]
MDTPQQWADKSSEKEKETFVSPLGFQLPVQDSDYSFPSKHQLPRYEPDEPHTALPPSYSNSEKLFVYPTPAPSSVPPSSAFFPSPEPSTTSSVPSPTTATALLPPAPISQQAPHALHIPIPIPSRSVSPAPESSRSLSAIIAEKYRPPTTLARSLDTPAAWLALYFAFNLGLTLYNKGVLVKFPFPYTLTAVHALCGSIGCWIALELGYFKPQPLTRAETLTLGAFSILYTVNIAVSNISLQLVTVPFHQVVRAATPLFTIALAATLLPSRGPPSQLKLLSLLPVVAGVGFATYGDYYFTTWGLVLTLLGTFLAASKLSPPLSLSLSSFRAPQLHPLDLLLRMSPLAFVQCVLYAYTSGELERVRVFGATEMTRPRALALLFNGIIAFGLNVVSFTANKRTGPLTMTVAANVKQVLTIVLAVLIFDLTITPMNLLGIGLTLAGGGWYGAIEYGEKRRKSRG